jgi:dTDP-glucose 4,6-dehydratase
MRLLVTGGAGFIGSHFVCSLLANDDPGYANCQVTVVDKLTYAGDRSSIPEEHPRLRFVAGDVCDLPLLLDLVPGHDAVVHFAAESHVDRSIESANEFTRTNVLGTQTLLEACLRGGVERVLHVSTDEVYGSIAEGSWTEESPLQPNSPYAASKAASDLMARSYWRTHGLNLSITRCSNNFGPCQHPEKLIPLFITNLLQGRPLPLYGDGRNVRAWLHVDDHCRALRLVLASGRAGEIYNIGGTELTNLAVTSQLLELCGADQRMVRHVADRKAHDLRYCADDSKISRELGYAPRIGFAEGLAATVAWYRDNPGWWKRMKQRAVTS